MEMSERRIPSSDGIHKLYCRVYTPDGEIKGLFHLVHGMTEHISRYDRFMREMADEGYVCYGFDNLGHGYTADDDSELGYLGDWNLLVSDVQNVSSQMKQEFGEQLPCYLMGHSMGSFIARCAATPKIWQKAIFMGTGGPNPAAGPGLLLIRAKIKKNGEKAYAPDIEKLMFGSYAKHFKEENDVIAWLSTQKEVRDVYRKDKFCTFHFTLNGFFTLLKLQMLSNSNSWFSGISDALPLMLVSGSDDPVGSYSKGVKKVYKRLRANGKNVQMKIYPGARHEILNEPCHDEVVSDILSFIQSE